MPKLRLHLATGVVAASVASGLAVIPAPAHALTSTQYTLMVDEFERTYGRHYVAIGSTTERNRCVVPDDQLKILNPSLYDQQIKERVACEQAMTQLVEDIRQDPTWSPALDETLTVFGQRYEFLPAIQLREQRRARQVDSFRQHRWSVAMEQGLGELARVDNGARFVLELARKNNRTRVEDADWSATVEQVLAPMVAYDDAAKSLLDAKRQAYLAQWEDKEWSELMEQVLAPMATRYAIAQARALLDAKRKEALGIWVDQDYSDEMEKALSALAPFYPAAMTLLEDKKAALVETSTPQTPALAPGEETPGPTPDPDKPEKPAGPLIPPGPGESDPAPVPTPVAGSSAGPSNDLGAEGIAGIVFGVLAALGIAGTALYFAWFGI